MAQAAGWTARGPRGLGAMVGVLFLSVIAIGMAAAWTLYDQYLLGWQRDRMAGQVWGEWLQVLDGATIPPAWAGGGPTAVAALTGADVPLEGLGPGSGAGMPQDLRFADMAFSYVLVPPDTGLACPSPTPGVYVCDRVGAGRLRPETLSRLDAVRRGAIDVGLRDMAIADSVGVLEGAEAVVAYEAELVSRLGAMQQGDLIAIAHLSIAREERALHRSPPPGHPDLARMNADLDMGLQNVTGLTGSSVEANSVAAAAGSAATAQADFAVVGSLSLTSTTLTHDIGESGGENEVLRIRNGNFRAGEVDCAAVPASEACSKSLRADAADMHMPGETLTVSDGIVSENKAVGTLTVSGRCRGCVNF